MHVPAARGCRELPCGICANASVLLEPRFFGELAPRVPATCATDTFQIIVEPTVLV